VSVPQASDANLLPGALGASKHEEAFKDFAWGIARYYLRAISLVALIAFAKDPDYVDQRIPARTVAG
jgi:hypothetical protein